MGKCCANCQPSGVQELGESPVQEHEVISLNDLDQPSVKSYKFSCQSINLLPNLWDTSQLSQVEKYHFYLLGQCIIIFTLCKTMNF